MKKVYLFCLGLLFCGISKVNAQSMLEKWEDLNNVSQIFTKVEYVVNENRYDILAEYTGILETYSNKLSVKNAAEITNVNLSDNINSLKSKAKELNLAAKNKATAESVRQPLSSFKEALESIISKLNTEK